jgi:hypothetical protein
VSEALKIEALPFTGPSPQLMELLEFIAACRCDIERVSSVPRKIDPALLKEDACDD